MKMTGVQLCFIVFVILGLHTMKIMRTATIKGVVVQEDKVKTMWAIQGKDSTMVNTTEDGAFDVKVKPGLWKIIICTNRAYQQYKVVENIETTEGKDTDLGRINLE
jgi:hypothetical protein